MTHDNDEFEIREDQILGKGSRGTVYRGRKRGFDRDVAIKVLREGYSQSNDFPVRFRRDVELLVHVKDPHLVQCLGAGTWKGRSFYAMEFVEGDDLGTLIRKGYKFTTEEILHIAEGVGWALRAAWKHQLLHCDIKPSNIFIAADGTVKVSDCGFASSLFVPRDAQFAAGTWRYLSPEQGLGEPADIRSDLYSLGVVLYELATGNPPFDGYDSTTSLVYQMVFVQPVPPRSLGASTPRELESIIMRCLRKSPEERFEDPDEFLQAVEGAKAALQASQAPAVAGTDDPGDFEIQEDQPLGEGGMGSIYRARQVSLDRSVAVKVLRDLLSVNPDFVQRFRREAELLAQVNDVHVIQVFGTGTWKGKFFYAMELVEGEDLATRLKKGHRFTTEEILYVAEGVAQALRAAWKYKIVHRDIKPSNILLASDGTIKIADFGLAKSLRIPHTESQLIAGTSEYLSPEQGTGRRVDIRSDIYSLGVVLYELASGRPPFSSEGHSVIVIYQHVHEPIPPLKEVGTWVPEALQKMIEKCLSKDPADRYQSPEELLEEIESLRRSLHPARMKASAPPLLAYRWSWLRRALRKPLVILPSLLLILIAAGGIIWSQVRKSHESREKAVLQACDLGLALGDYEGVLWLAERSLDEDSPRLAEIRKRCRNRKPPEGERQALDRVDVRDWAGAGALYEGLLPKADEARRTELAAASAYCREMGRAYELERQQKWNEALAIYRHYESSAPYHREYLQERIRRIAARSNKL